jgi:hypothetical protein
MRLFLDICQGAGLAAAAGMRPFLPALLAGALAKANLGLDFGGTDFAFLESPGFLLAVVIALMATVLAERRSGAAVLEQGPFGAALAGAGIGLGALESAGSLADHGYSVPAGLAVGVLAALLGQAAVRSLLTRTRRRLDAQAQSALPVYVDGTALALAGAAVLAPPVSLLALAFLAWLLIGARRRGGEKYAGLRILR